MSVILSQSDDGNKYDALGEELLDGSSIELSTASPDQISLPVLLTEPEKGGKGGEGGAAVVTNADFIAAVFRHLPEGAFPAVCTKEGNPDLGSWPAKRADQFADNLPSEANNYVNCSSFGLSDDGVFKARKEQFAACHFLMLDDIGTKVPMDRLTGFLLSWLIETSPGNYQAGIILSEPLTDGATAARLLDALIKAGFCDAGASGPSTCWARPATIPRARAAETGAKEKSYQFSCCNH